MVLIAFGGYLGWQHFQTSESVLIKSIDVSGLERVSQQEVLSYSNLQIGTPVFNVALEQTAAAIRQHPWIDEVTVRRRLPDGVFIDVNEFKPAILVSMGNVYVANPEGRVFKRLAQQDHLNLPVVTGLAASESGAAEEANRRIIFQAIQLHEAISQHEASLGRLEEIHYDPHLYWSIVLRHKRMEDGVLTLHLGEHPSRRMSVARQALTQLRKRTRVPSVIWLDGETHPERLHVRFTDSRKLAAARPFSESTTLLTATAR